jgi:hypothetical protein
MRLGSSGSPGGGAPRRDVFTALAARLRDELFVNPLCRPDRAHVHSTSHARRAQGMQFPQREFLLPVNAPGGSGGAVHSSLSPRVATLLLHPAGPLAPL